MVCGIRRDASRSPGQIKAEDRDALQRNLALAEELGATVVRVKADRPADGLIAFAQREGITHVISDKAPERGGRSFSRVQRSTGFSRRSATLLFRSCHSVNPARRESTPHGARSPESREDGLAGVKEAYSVWP